MSIDRASEGLERRIFVVDRDPLRERRIPGGKLSIGRSFFSLSIMSIWRPLSIVSFQSPFNRHLFGLLGLSSTSTTMFLPFFLLLRLLLFLFQCPDSSGNDRWTWAQVQPMSECSSLGSRYGASCVADSGCDQHQKCISRTCRCNPDERRFWTGNPVQWLTVSFWRVSIRCRGRMCHLC